MKLIKQFGALAFLVAIFNFACIGGLIFFVFWCLKHFGIIGG